MPGHDSGHDPGPPVGLDWGGYVAAFREDLGSWTTLADTLIQRASGDTEIPGDVQSVEKGLRRLAGRGHQPGGQYGRWMLRHFGVPPSVERWASWMGQFHSRFADLPVSLRLEQLRLWDRPPISESRVATWIHVGMASVLLRMRDLGGCGHRLSLASQGAARAGPAAAMEVGLLAARMATDGGDRQRAAALLDQVGLVLEEATLDPADRVAYQARLLGQRAYHLTRPVEGEAPAADLHAARALFEQIPADTALPFARFRRANGLAYCAWKLGDPATGAALAREAAAHAGDGGLVRFRVMALNLLARVLDEPEATVVRNRATHLARMLEDEDLVHRVAKQWG